MRKSIMILLVALAATPAAGLHAEAAGRDPLVIQGIGPDDMGVRPQHTMRRPGRPDNRQKNQRRIKVATSGAHGQYGGGFIEFLMTGSSGPGARVPVRRVESPYYRRSSTLPARKPRRRGYRREALASPEPSFRRRVSSVVPDKYSRQEVAYSSKYRRGTIVVDTPNRFLYLVLGNGRALRYGIGVGRPGFEWSGVKRVTRKSKWPDWRPPASMRKRRPDLPKFMAGGPSNPLGARALYLGSSLYRIHGTNEPHTIGRNVSSGCIRLMNKDVIHLFQRAKVGAKVIVI